MTGQEPPPEGYRPTAQHPELAPVTDAPVADGRERRLDPRSVLAARLSGAVFLVVVGSASALAVLATLLLGAPKQPMQWVLPAGWLLFVGGLALWVLLWPALRYRRVSYRVDEHGIRIRRGVIWRSEISVPRSRVQHTDVSQGPVERGFGLATLIIHTAGTEHASVSLGGVDRSSALRVRDHLIGGGDDDAV